MTANGRTWTLRAPCAFWLYPGPVFHYGPDGSWDELFLSYRDPQPDELRRRGYFNPDDPVWDIADSTAICAHFRTLQRMDRNGIGPGTTDRIDRICESLLLECSLGRTATAPTASRAVHAVMLELSSRPGALHAPEAMARRLGVPPSTFRRQWKRETGMSPTQWLERFRLQESCRLLQDTDLPISAIADQLGFASAAYFARRFRCFVGSSARTFRKTHRISPW